MGDPETETPDSDQFIVDAPAKSFISWVGPTGCLPPEFAATELASYIEKMTGDRPSVAGHVGDLSDNQFASSIVFSLDNQTQSSVSEVLGKVELNIEAVKDNSDAFVIREISDSTLILAGCTHRATLYAVYALLESAGIQFLAPNFDFYDGQAEIVPDVDSVAFDSTKVTESPTYSLRRKYIEEGWSHTSETLQALVDWLAKSRHNVLVCPTDYRQFGITKWADFRESIVPEVECRGLLIETGGHGFHSFLDPSDTEQNNSEWFVDGANVFDIANPEAVDAYLDRVCSYLRSHPEVDIFDAWPPDNPVWPDSTVEKFGSVGNAYAYLINRLQERVSTEFPERTIRIEAIAYLNHIEPPDTEYMYDTRCIVDFAPVDRSYEVSLFDKTANQNEQYAEYLEAWDKSFNGTIGIHEYYRKYSWHSLPVVLKSLIGSEVAAYHAHGASGFGTYSEPADWIPYEFTHLLVSKLLWDPSIDTETLFERYLEARYPEKQKIMSDYFEAIERAGQALFTEFGGEYQNQERIITAREAYLDAKAAIEVAISNSSGNNAANSVLKCLQTNIEFAIADTEITYYGLQGETEQARAAKQRCLEKIKAGRFSGAVLQSHWTVRRCVPIDIPNDTGWMRNIYRKKW